MGTTEREVLRIVGEKGRAGKTQLTQRLGISPGYADIVCKALIREGYLRISTDRYFTLAPAGAKLLSAEGWKFVVDRSMVEEVAKGVAKEFSKELKGFRPAREYAPRRRRRTAEAPMDIGAKDDEIQIKTSFIAPMELEEVEMESNLDKVTTDEKEKFDLGGAIAALKKVKK